MTIFDVPVADIEWTTWWLLGSAATILIGFAGWQISQFFIGAKIIAQRDEKGPRFNWVREKMLPGYLANRSFKREVSGRLHRGGIGRLCFNLMLLGSGAHVAFWVYAVNFMDK
ncbi:hypothetical protein [Nitratireductor basaltis]|uniref:Uncharacterized protein n=1 Tax=Nitratireductor basaltis TaxID=472175 RepID=A0A084U7T9_9HYPH|nr:hypothetical protein [Nitratireductor basaltis]KFB09025.1 hypothetical protein EL18_00039 [Nitratireductor basaltis]